MSNTPLGNMIGKTAIVAIGNVPYVISGNKSHYAEDKVHKYVNGKWEIAVANSFHNQSNYLSAFEGKIYSLNNRNGDTAESKFVYRKEAQQWIADIGSTQFCEFINAINTPHGIKYLALFSDNSSVQVISIFTPNHGWKNISISNNGKKLIPLLSASFDDRFYFQDRASREIYKCRYSDDERWAAQLLPNPDNLQAKSIAVHNGIICMVDTHHKVYVHNSISWELMHDDYQLKDGMNYKANQVAIGSVRHGGTTLFTMATDGRIYKNK